MTRWMWCSFAGETGNLGIAIVEATDPIEASLRCHRLGINPGGELLAIPLPADERPAPGFTDRLMSVDEASRAFGREDQTVRVNSNLELVEPDA